MNRLIFVIALTLYINAVKGCGTIASNTCENLLANSTLSCEEICAELKYPIEYCNEAEPELEKAILEDCIGGTNFWGPTTSCMLMYRSKSLQQDVCVTKDLFEAINNGSFQFQWATIMKKSPCNRLREGQQICFNSFASMKCSSGFWRITHLCTPGRCLLKEDSPYCILIAK